MDDSPESAPRWGVERGYHDVFGNWHDASAETLTRLTAAVSAGRDQPAEWPQVSNQERAFQGDGRRHWALAVQLYAARSQRNWGHGDFGDLAALLEVAAAAGAGAIGLNPLHALFPDRADQASPYSPNSRLFLNVLYIDVDAIPEFPGQAAAGLAKEIRSLRETEMVDYPRVARAKLIGLRLAYDQFRSRAAGERRDDFESYRAEQGEALLRYSSFECLRKRYGTKPWWDWPQQWRAPSRQELETLRKSDVIECGFHEFVQWIADRQLRDCKLKAKQLGMAVGLYIDVAVGVDPAGADAWIQADAILKDISVGAPPDELNRAGQNWGLTTYNPQVLAAQNFEPIRLLLRAAMRHAGAIRLDHVLGLKRIYMIPRGLDGTQGAYVNFPFDGLLAVIAEESNSARCVVIGEDLGTVPEGFRETLTARGIWLYRVMLFERGHDGAFRPPEQYPAQALATFNTHDLATFRGWFTDHDLEVKRAIDLDPGETNESRDAARAALHTALRLHVAGHQEGEFDAIAAFLAATPSLLVSIGIEDVLGMTDQVNVPGTTDQHPNWRRRLPVAIENLESDGRLRRIGDVLARAGRGRQS